MFAKLCFWGWWVRVITKLKQLSFSSIIDVTLPRVTWNAVLSSGVSQVCMAYLPSMTKIFFLIEDNRPGTSRRVYTKRKPPLTPENSGPLCLN